MFPNNNSQALVHLPGKPAPTDNTQLPRGECSFILPESEAPGGASRQRCSCRSFFPDSVVRSRCGCGHQAWNHEAQPLSTVSMEEYVQAIEQMKKMRQDIKRFETLERDLKQELFKERMAREELIRVNRAIELKMYENMRNLKVTIDDRVEAVIDKTTELSNEIRTQGERLILVDEFSMELENRVDRVEQLTGMSRDVTPAASTPKGHHMTPKAQPVPQLPLLMQSQTNLGQLPFRTEKKYPVSWSVRVIFVLSKNQPFAYDPDSAGYRRCASRKLQQNLEFPSQDSSCFASHIENAFKGIFRGRPWMPMTGHRPSDEPFGRMALTILPSEFIHRNIWEYPFLEDHCIAHDKMQGDLLYITLQYEDVTWNEVRFLPPVTGADESCWNHDEDLDGTAEYKSLDSEIMYDYPDPPPTYSSRINSMVPSTTNGNGHSTPDANRPINARTPSGLDVLADTALLSPIDRTNTASSSQHSLRLSLSPMARTPTHSSTHSASTPRFSSERSSLHSFSSENMTEDDEHRDKKQKLRAKHSLPTFGGGSSSHTHHGHANGGPSSSSKIYVSGRSKRKMPDNKPLKEPLRFDVASVGSSMTRWRLHPGGSGKGKDAVS